MKCSPFLENWIILWTLACVAIDQTLQINTKGKWHFITVHAIIYHAPAKGCMRVSFFRILFSSNQMRFYEQVCNILNHQLTHMNWIVCWAGTFCLPSTDQIVRKSDCNKSKPCNCLPMRIWKSAFLIHKLQSTYKTDSKIVKSVSTFINKM